MINCLELGEEEIYLPSLTQLNQLIRIDVEQELRDVK